MGTEKAISAAELESIVLLLRDTGNPVGRKLKGDVCELHKIIHVGRYYIINITCKVFMLKQQV